MKGAYGVRQPLLLGGLLAVLFVLGLGRTIVEQRNVTALGESFSAVYKDRLLAESYLLDLNEQLYRKQALLDQCAGQLPNQVLRTQLDTCNSRIAHLLGRFARTRLTEPEAVVFRRLRRSIGAETALEARFLEQLPAVGSLPTLQHHFQEAQGSLRILSRIQVEEGRQLEGNSRMLVAGSFIMRQLEVVLLIVVGLLALVLVFTARSLVSRFPQQPHLN